MCCGRTTKPTPRLPSFSNPPAGRTSDAGPRPTAWFEYRGATALTVVSPHTGATYRFAAPGARLAVDPRDRAWVTFVPNLARVS
jgi:hypothetical protein